MRKLKRRVNINIMPKSNKVTGRDYSYDKKYENSPEQIKHREERNISRAEMEKYLIEKYGKAKAMQILAGKDVDHKKALSAGGSNSKKNRRLRSIHSNRGDKTY